MALRMTWLTSAQMTDLVERSDDDLELDDPNEPIMEGSDDEFSDLSGMESEEEDEDGPHPMQSSITAIS